MARFYDVKLKKRKLLQKSNDSWIRGLNTTVSNTQIRNNELSLATDVQLVEDGKVQCPRDGQAYFGGTSGSRVRGLHSFYESDGTRTLLRTEGTALQSQNESTGVWSTISGKTYTSDLDTDMLTAYDRAYICNGTDNLSYYDGSSIVTFTELSAPTISSVVRTGSAGSFTFSYKVTAVTDVGETLPSAAVSTTLDQADLDTSNYMTITWGSVSGAKGYNVYGRKDQDWTFITYVEGESSLTYIDQGTLTPSTVFTPPEANSTGGPIGAQVELYKDSLFIAGDPNNPSRVYYSGGGDKINDFTIGGGGGFVDVSRNDGQAVTGMIVFKDKLLIFKERSTYQFSFTTSGLPQVEVINTAVGCAAPRSIVAVENDVLFMSEVGLYAIGNEAGFAFDVLRTNELSSKVRSIIRGIEPSELDRVAGVYVNDADKKLVIFSYTPAGQSSNSEALVWDRERLAWYKWTNIKASCWSVWKDSDGSSRFLYGDDSSGYVKEVLTGTDDFGSAISGGFPS